MRKKTPTNTNTATAAVNLDDDEQLVEEITTTKKIGRQRRTPASEEVITVELEEEESESPEFPDGSLAAVLFGDSSEAYENQFCTIQIRRHPDSMNDNFLNPCGAVTNLPPLRNIELTAETMDIEERVRAIHGGGHYYFQIYYNGSLGKSWKSTLADDPQAVARAKAEADAKNNPQPAAVQAASPTADPMDSMLNSIVKMKQLKDALFGDEEKRLQREIDDLKAQAEAAKNATPAANPQPQSEQLYILEKALGTSNTSLQEKLLDYAFPSDGGSHWIPQTLGIVFDHKEEIAGILGGLLGGFAPKPPPNAIANMLRQQPPTPIPAATESEPAALPTSSFRRRPVTTETPASPEVGSDEGDKTAADILSAIEPPSAEFLASISISPAEIIDPAAIENEIVIDGEVADEISGNDKEQTDNGK